VDVKRLADYLARFNAPEYAFVKDHIWVYKQKEEPHKITFESFLDQRLGKDRYGQLEKEHFKEGELTDEGKVLLEGHLATAKRDWQDVFPEVEAFDWPELDRTFQDAKLLLKFLKEGGVPPVEIKGLETLLGRRTFVGNWANRITQLMGGYLMYENEAGRQREACFQLVRDCGDRRTVEARILPSARSKLSKKEREIMEETAVDGLVRLPIKKAIPFFDLISPAPLAAKAAELSSKIDKATDHLAYALQPGNRHTPGMESEPAYDKLSKELAERHGATTYTFTETKTKAPGPMTREYVDQRMAQREELLK